MFFGTFIPIKIVLNPIGQLIIYLAGKISDIKWVYSSTNYTIVMIASIIFTILFFGFFIVRIKHKKTAIFSLSAILCFIFAISSLLTYANDNKSQIIYYCNEGEQIILSDGGDLCVVEIADYGKSSAYEAIDSITETKLTRIDKYVFTHYSHKLEHNINTLLKSMLIEEIYIPTPKNDTENRIFNTISDEISHYRASLCVYKADESIDVGNYTVYPIYHSEIGETKKNILTIYSKEKVYTYLNVDTLQDETKNMALETIALSDAIIFGRHESGSADYKFTYKLENAETVVFSSERIVMNTDTLFFYEERKAIFNPEKINLKR